MYQINKLENLVTQILNRFIMQFPVAYINTIVFFKHEQLVAQCYWNHSTNAVLLIADKQQPLYMEMYKGQKTISDVEISGIDTDGKVFLLKSTLQHFLESTKR